MILLNILYFISVSINTKLYKHAKVSLNILAFYVFLFLSPDKFGILQFSMFCVFKARRQLLF